MRKTTRLAVVSLAILALVLGASCDLINTLILGKDTTAPTAEIISPAPGSVVTGQVLIQIDASDAGGLFKVVFLVDGQISGDDRTAPWEWTWNTATVSSGTHFLKAEAWDDAGNVGESASIEVTVVGGNGGAYAENFDGYPLGSTGSLSANMPEDASWQGLTTGAGSLDIVSDPAGAGHAPSLRLAQTTSAADNAILFAAVPGAAKGEASLSLYLETGGSARISLGSGDLNTSRTALFLWLVKKTEGVVPAWFTNSTKVAFGDTVVSTGAWHELRIVFDCGAGEWGAYLDDQALVTRQPLTSAFTAAGPFTLLEYLSIDTTPLDTPYAGGAFLVDDLAFGADSSVVIPDDGSGPAPSIEGPASLTATAGTGGVTLSWADSSTDEDDFLVVRDTDVNFGSMTLVDTLAAGTTTYLDTTALSETTYYYVVVAHRLDGVDDVFGYSPVKSVTTLPPPSLASGVYVAGSLGNKAVIWHDNGAAVDVIELTDGSRDAAANDLCVDSGTIWATGWKKNAAGIKEPIRWSVDANDTVGTTVLKTAIEYNAEGKAIAVYNGQVYIAGEDGDVVYPYGGICATLWVGTTMTHVSNPDAYSTGNGICLITAMTPPWPVVAGNLNSMFGAVSGYGTGIYAMDWLDDGSAGNLSPSASDGRAYDIVSSGLNLFITGSLRDGTYNRATYWIDDFSTITPYKFGPVGVASQGNAIAVESGTVWCAGTYTKSGGTNAAALWSGVGASMTLKDLPLLSTEKASAAEDLARAGGVSWLAGTWMSQAGANTACFWTVSGTQAGRRDLSVAGETVTVKAIALVDPTPDYTAPSEPEPPAVPPAYPTGVTQSGLVAFYPFSGNATDASGNSYNGFVDRATLAADRFGNASSAYSFDGVNSNVSNTTYLPDLGTRASISATGIPLALSVWIKPDSVATGTVDPIICRVRYDGSTWGTGGYLLRLLNTDGTVDIGFDIIPEYGGQPSRVYNADAIKANTWSHVAVSYLPWGTTSVYVNGTLIGSTGDDPAGPTTLPFYIGLTNKASGTAERFKGIIDDVRVFNRDLTPDDVAALYAEGGWPL